MTAVDRTAAGRAFDSRESAREPTGRRLGRGLETLIEASRTDDSGVLFHLPPEVIDVDPRNPRRAAEAEDERFRELRASIERHGVLEPLLVRAGARPDRFTLVCGERRLRAARALGLASVPCRKIEVPEERVLEVMLIENLHREDLDPIAEAQACRALIEEHGYTQEALAERLARSRPAIANALRLLDLPEAVQEKVARGRISAGHGRAIAALPSKEAQEALARRVEEEGLSVRETEAAARAGQAARRPRRRRERPSYLVALEERLQKALGTKVAIEQTGPGRGRIVIEFYSDDHFEALLEALE
jgi:ParB family chromosome partitioning protein